MEGTALITLFFTIMATQTAPSAGKCQGNAAFQDPGHSMDDGFRLRKTTTKNLDDCARQCIDYGSKCVSGKFYNANITLANGTKGFQVLDNNCELSSETRTSRPDKYITYDDYYHKMWIYFEPCTTKINASSVFDHCRELTSFSLSQRELIGYVGNTTTAKDMTDCAWQCIQKGNKCRSGMFYSQGKTNNCALNTESRVTRPNAFVNTTVRVAVVEYFEPCSFNENLSSCN